MGNKGRKKKAHDRSRTEVDFNQNQDTVQSNAIQQKQTVHQDNGSFKALKEATEKKLGMTPLSVVAAIGDYSGTEKYLKNKTDPDGRCLCDNSTPLMLAVKNKHKDVVKLLLEYGADCTLVNNDGNNAFMIAIRSGEAQVINTIWPYRNELYIDHCNNSGFTALHMAAERKWECCVQFLLANGANTNVQSATGSTPLMLAANKGDLKTTEKLVSAGADILLEDSNGLTAICFSQKDQRTEIEDFLLGKLYHEQRDYFIKTRMEFLKQPPIDLGNSELNYYIDILFPILSRTAEIEPFRRILYSHKVIAKVLDKQKENLTDFDLLRSVSIFICALIFNFSTTVDERFVKQYINCKGPDFTIDTLKYYTEKMRIPERDTLLYFVPMVSVVEIPEGKSWLTKHWSIVSEYANFFKQGIDTYHYLERNLRSRVAVAWKHFYDFLGEIQKHQREKKMAELLAQEERERVKKEKKKDKKKVKKQNQKQPLKNESGESEPRAESNDHTVVQKVPPHSQRAAASPYMTVSDCGISKEHFLCKDEQLAFLMSQQADNWTTVQGKRKEKPKPPKKQPQQTTKERKQSKAAKKRQTETKSEAQVPGSSSWAMIAKNKEQKRKAEMATPCPPQQDQVIVTAEDFPSLCGSTQNMRTAFANPNGNQDTVCVTNSNTSLTSYARVVREKERTGGAMDDWWEKAPLRNTAHSTPSNSSVFSTQTDQVTASSATDEDLAGSEYDPNDWSVVNSARASGMAAAYPAHQYCQQLNNQICSKQENPGGCYNNPDCTNLPETHKGQSQRLPLYARRFEEVRPANACTAPAQLPEAQMNYENNHNKQIKPSRANRGQEQYRQDETPAVEDSHWKMNNVKELTAQGSDQDLNNVYTNNAVANRNAATGAKSNLYLSEIAVGLVTGSTKPPEQTIFTEDKWNNQTGSDEGHICGNYERTEQSVDPVSEELPTWYTEPFENISDDQLFNEMDIIPEVYESDEDTPAEIRKMEEQFECNDMNKKENFASEVRQGVSTESYRRDNRDSFPDLGITPKQPRKPSMHWPESWGPCPEHLKTSEGNRSGKSQQTNARYESLRKKHKNTFERQRNNNVVKNTQEDICLDTETTQPVSSPQEKLNAGSPVLKGTQQKLRYDADASIQRPVNSVLGQSILRNACAIDTRPDEVLFPSDLNDVPQQRDLETVKQNHINEEVLPDFPSIHDATKLSAHYEKNAVSVFHKLQQLQLLHLKSYYDAVCGKNLDNASIYKNDFYYYASCTGLDYKQIYNYLGVKEDLKGSNQNQTTDPLMNSEATNMHELPTKGHQPERQAPDCPKEPDLMRSPNDQKMDRPVVKVLPNNSCVLKEVEDSIPFAVIKSRRWREKLEELQRLTSSGRRKIGNIIIPIEDQAKYIITHSNEPVVLGYLKDGSAVAVQIINCQTHPVHEEELKGLMTMDVSQYFIIKYRDYAISDNYVYLAMELYEYTIDEYIHVLNREQGLDALSTNKLVWQLLRGLDNLHQHCHIVHGALKPENVLVDIDNKIRVGGYGLSHNKSYSNNFLASGSLAAEKNRCWMSPEVLMEESGHTFKTDVWVAGMLIYFILSGGKHPFGSTTYEIQVNLCRNALSMCYISEEASDLLSQMMSANPNDRPSIADAIGHPYFWAEEKRLRFILIAGSDVLRDLKAGVPIVGGTGDSMIDILSSSSSAGQLANWIPEMDPLIVKEMRSFRQYKNTVVELVLFVYNCCLHFEKMSDAARQLIDEPCKYFLGHYPTLFMAVYQAIKSSARTEKTCYKPFF